MKSNFLFISTSLLSLFLIIGFLFYAIDNEFHKDSILKLMGVILTSIFGLLFIRSLPSMYCIESDKSYMIKDIEVNISQKDMHQVLIKVSLIVIYVILLILIIVYLIEITIDTLRLIFALSLLAIPIRVLVRYLYTITFWKKTKAIIDKIELFHREDKIYQNYDDYQSVYHYQYNSNNEVIKSHSNYKTFTSLNEFEQTLNNEIEIWHNSYDIHKSTIIVPMESKYKLLYMIFFCFGVGLLFL